MQNTAKNTLSDATAPPIAPDKPAEADVPAIVLTAAQPGGGGRLPPLTPPTSPEHDPRDFALYKRNVRPLREMRGQSSPYRPLASIVSPMG